MGESYQWEVCAALRQPKLDPWDSSFGPRVIKRDKKGEASEVEFRLLTCNPRTEVYLIGPFNDWGKKPSALKGYRLVPDALHEFASVTIPAIHKTPYKFLLKGEKDNESDLLLADPAGTYMDDEGNSVVWDYEHLGAYQQQHPFVDTVNRATKILQTDLPGLIVHWRGPDKRMGSDIPQSEYYQFIAESGVLEHIKELGFNTIQFLPFAQSIDGDNWKYRYLVAFPFAIQKNWGTPDDFARMVDKCHELGIAVIGDFIISHAPYKDFKICGEPSENSGIHHWRNGLGGRLYVNEETPWGSVRPDYGNSHVRTFFVESCLFFLRRYQVDGFRIDNVDGILRHGDNGEGPEREHGRLLLRQLCKTLYAHNPHALIHFESHYFYGDNAKLLVMPISEDLRALGGTAYNSSRMTYYLHTEYMPKSIESVTPWRFRDIAAEKEWGRSNSTVADFHNHDAAAGLMEMRATGSYAFDAMTQQPGVEFHAIGKIKVMEGIIAFCAEGRILDLVQTFLLQTGTFEHDSSIQWFLEMKHPNKDVLSFKQAVNKLLDNSAFWPAATNNRQFLNVDDANKVLVVERSSEKNTADSEYVIVINLSAESRHEYRIGVRGTADYELVLNSDEYSGTGTTMPRAFKNLPSTQFEVLDREVTLPVLPAYGVVVLKRSINDS